MLSRRGLSCEEGRVYNVRWEGLIMLCRRGLSCYVDVAYHVRWEELFILLYL